MYQRVKQINKQMQRLSGSKTLMKREKSLAKKKPGEEVLRRSLYTFLRFEKKKETDKSVKRRIKLRSLSKYHRNDSRTTGTNDDREEKQKEEDERHDMMSIERRRRRKPE